MKRTEKAFLVEDLAARIKDAKSAVLVDYQGLPVKELNKLRDAMKEAGGQLIVVKNTLLRLALAKLENGKADHSFGMGKMENLGEALVGPTAVVFAEEDEIAPLQTIGRFLAEFERPKFKFGIFGQSTYDAEKLLALSRLPGREALLGRLLGTIAGPKYALVSTLEANLQQLIYILNAKAQQGGES